MSAYPKMQDTPTFWSSPQGRQLPLDLQPDRRAVLERFLLCTANQELGQALARFQAAEGPNFLYLYGPPGEGRSHLLQGVCQGLSEGVSYYLPLATLHSFAPRALLDGLDAGGLLCLDDLEAAVGDIHWERALFHLFNRSQRMGGRLLCVASLSPGSLSPLLPDLASRLSSGAVYRLSPLGEKERSALLEQRALERGLQLEEGVLRFILERSHRSTGSLLALLERLDRASMAARRRLTIPFVKEVCDW